MPQLLSDEDLLARLVAFDTTSHRSNLPLVDFLCEYLARPGVRISRHLDPTGDKANLVVEAGPPVDPVTRSGLVLSGHTDVVPAEEPEWTTDPFSLAVRDDNLYARGSADMKGFLALATNLLARLANERLAAPLVLLFTYDEEVGTLGARHFRQTWPLDQRPLPRRALIGEPTECRVIRVHKGHLKMKVTLLGESAHSAYPHLGSNAIEPAARLIASLRNFRVELEARRLPSSLWFPEVPFPSLNVATISGGTAVNIVPDRCELGFGVRLLPGLDAETLQQELADRIAEALDGFPHRLETLSLSPPMELPEGSSLFDQLQAVAGTGASDEPPAVSFATDAGWFQQLGMDCVLYGPGSIKVAHRPNEFIPRDELVAAASILSTFASQELALEPDPG